VLRKKGKIKTRKTENGEQKAKEEELPHKFTWAALGKIPFVFNFRNS
jgi:hypothetical protein